MIVEGMSEAAAARVCSTSSATIARWLVRASDGAATLCDRTLRTIEVEELQSDELRGFIRDKEHRAYVFATIEVGSRLWLSKLVGRRTLRCTRLFLRDTRNRCDMSKGKLLLVTDSFRYYRQEAQRTWNVSCLHVEVKKRIVDGRVRRTDSVITNGVKWQLDRALERCRDSEQPNTSYIERLNLFMRRSLAYLHRRTTSLARSKEKLEAAIDLLQCYYNFVRPHGALVRRGVPGRKTPAMAAGIATRVVSLREIFMSMGVAARRPWLARPEARESLNRRWACAGNNS